MGRNGEMMEEEARRLFGRTSKVLWRILVAITGFGVMAVGVTLLVLPGPGLLVVFLGLAILATEFRWARHLLNRAVTWVKKGRQRLKAEIKRYRKCA